MRPAPASTPSEASVPAVVPAPHPPSAASAAPPVRSEPEADACHLTEELARAREVIAPDAKEPEWVAEARARLLSQEGAQRALTGISQEIVSAIAHKRYDNVAALIASEGVCLRPAKGAPCHQLSARELAACGHSSTRTAWAVDGGAEQAKYTCAEAFRHIFYPRDFLRHVTVRFNCFPDPGRGKSPSPLVLSGPRSGYVEMYSAGSPGEGWRSLWLVFDGEPDTPVLVEMISEGGQS